MGRWRVEADETLRLIGFLGFEKGCDSEIGTGRGGRGGWSGGISLPLCLSLSLRFEEDKTRLAREVSSSDGKSNILVVSLWC